jgi:hypothetical protein
MKATHQIPGIMRKNGDDSVRSGLFFREILQVERDDVLDAGMDRRRQDAARPFLVDGDGPSWTARPGNSQPDEEVSK